MEDKKYFNPGDLVVLSKSLPNAPVMMVMGPETFLVRSKVSIKGTLKGIRCRWFTKDGFVQEAVFNTKDLSLY